ncbi:hypothetical protein [Ewingella americana]|nr:hypothetical protein [Ewingella americana]
MGHPDASLKVGLDDINTHNSEVSVKPVAIHSALAISTPPLF